MPHAFLHSGDPCPECKRGKVYEVSPPGVLVRLVGAAPLQAKVYELQKLRCHLCGKVFTAEAPKTLNGAHVGDVYMSPIYTCQLCEANPFDYLTELQRHAAQLSSNPQQWMPWNYRATLQELAARSAAAR